MNPVRFGRKQPQRLRFCVTLSAASLDCCWKSVSHLVLARKFRPQDFGSVSGQEHVTRPLANAIKRNLISHAFLFCGPRGVGKTTVARVLSKALNCETGPTATPCLKCTNCREITEGRSLAVREIDGASHNSVENVRDLIDTLRSQPPPGSRFKVYIIDEVHMLSVAAFNALLKNLEEPPPNTVFILATTDPQKIPETVLSRCQRYDFRAMSLETIEKKLQEIAKAESIDVEPEVFSLVARLADGSMRDAQSLMERVRSLSDGKITAEDASQALGVVKRSLLSDISKAVFSHKPDECLTLIGEAFSGGLDPRLFLNEFVSHWRELLIAKFSGVSGLSRIGLSKEAHKELLSQVENVGPADLQDLLYLAQQGCEQATRSLYPRIALEALVVRMATREPVVEVAKVLEALKKKDHKSGGREVVPQAISRESASNNLSPVSRSSTPQVETATSSSQVVRPKVAVKESEASVAGDLSANQNLRPVGSLKWRDFVDSVNKSGRAGMMGECLKRLSIESFEPGKLKAVAPKIAQEYFGDSENKAKLIDYLNGYFKAPLWDIKLSESTSKMAVTSIIEEDKKAQVSAQAKQKESATEHPAVLNIKKFFPGSTLG